MFSMHERNQRYVCRVFFVLTCALPTIVVICWAGYFNRPWQRQDWQETLENVLHLRARVNSVAAPRPWRRQFSSLEISGLKTERPFVNIRQLDLQSGSSMSAEAVVVDWLRVDELTHTMQVWLASEKFQPLKWHTARMQLTGATGSYQLTNVVGESAISADGARRIALQAQTGEGSRVRLVLERATGGEVHLTLNAQQAAFPAWLLAHVVPGAGKWGEAQIQGLLELEKVESSLSGSFRGTIQSIDAQEWLGEKTIRTKISLTLDALTWQDGRIQTAQGELETAEGQIHRALLEALKEPRLYCTIFPDVNQAVDYHVFNRAACRFDLSESGLTITGLCRIQSSPEGCLIEAEGKPLATQPAHSNLPTGHLVQVFCPLDKSWLPATREAIEMADRLPLPESATRKH